MRFINLPRILLSLLVWYSGITIAQEGFVLPTGKKHGRVDFKLVNNLVLIPVTINGAEFTFLLDTGSSNSVIFSFEAIDSLVLHNSQTFQLRGLGQQEPVLAIKSDNNVMEIGAAVHQNISLYVIFDGVLNFTSKLGVPIHGIIGTDFFKNFVVNVNYNTKKIKFYDPKTYRPKKCRKCVEIPLVFIHNKPYIAGQVVQAGVTHPVNLLIDSGSGDALWLFSDEEKNLTIPEEAFDDFLGLGINGDIYGKRYKVSELSLVGFTFKNVNVAYPEVEFLRAQFLQGIDGSVGGEILRRFHWVIDYQAKTLQLRPNHQFKTPFHYNMSGISLEHGELTLVREETVTNQSLSNKNQLVSSQNSTSITKQVAVKLMPSYVISEIRVNSPAHRAGLQIGDELLEINDVPAHQYKLYEIHQMFYTNEGKKMKLTVQREGVKRSFRFKLEDIQ